MSIKLMNLIFEKETHTSGSKRLVLLAIADNANDDGVCWPSLATIAHKANISREYTKQLVKELEEEGYLEITHRKNPDNRYATNIYKVIPVIDREAGTPTPADGEAGLPRGREAGTPRVGRQASPEPPIEPSLRTTTALSDRPNIFVLYENNFGTIQGSLVDELKDAESTYPDEWITEAFKIAAANNARRWSYVSSILKRWSNDGFKSDTRKKSDESTLRIDAATGRIL